MARPVTELQRLNRSEQERLYGAPLGDLLGEVAAVMGLTQGRIAGLLGLSAPMVSQLASVTGSAEDKLFLVRGRCEVHHITTEEIILAGYQYNATINECEEEFLCDA